MIDTTATEPPRNWFLEIAKVPTEDLLAEATRLRAKLAMAREAGHVFDARAYELRLMDVERAIAIHNRRATEAEDQRADPGVEAIRRRITRLTLAAGLPQEVWSELCHIDSALSVLTRDSTQPVPDPAQREADLREAYLAGYDHAADVAEVSEHDGWHRTDPHIEWPSLDKRDAAAAEHARSKAGG